MRNAPAIARRDFAAYFHSPAGPTIAALFLTLQGLVIWMFIQFLSRPDAPPGGVTVATAPPGVRLCVKPDPKRKRNAYLPNSSSVSIAGLTEGIGYRLGGCCHPIPGDRIIGLMVPGAGCVIHTIDCEVLDRHQDSMADWIDVRWKDYGGAFSVARIMVRVKNTTGALASIANVIGQNGANISNLKISNRNPLYFEFQVDVEVRDAAHLENLIRALKVDPTVEAVERVRGLDTDGDGAHVASESQGLLPFEHARH